MGSGSQTGDPLKPHDMIDAADEASSGGHNNLVFPYWPDDLLKEVLPKTLTPLPEKTSDLLDQVGPM